VAVSDRTAVMVYIREHRPGQCKSRGEVSGAIDRHHRTPTLTGRFSLKYSRSRCPEVSSSGAS
jgi:hypothetical protein